MSNFKTIFLLAVTVVCLFTDSVAQSHEVDAVNVDGYLITYVGKNIDKSNIDVIRGYYFIAGNLYDNCRKKKKLETLFDIDKKQNAIFLLDYGSSFFTMNALFFNNELNALILNETHFPKDGDYSFKNKDYLFKCIPIKVKCLKVTMSEKELIHFIAFDQYSFNFDKVPVFILQEIIEDNFNPIGVNRKGH